MSGSDILSGIGWNIAYDLAKGAIVSGFGGAALASAWGELWPLRKIIPIWIGLSLSLGFAFYFLTAPFRLAPNLSTCELAWIYNGISELPTIPSGAWVFVETNIINSGNMPSLSYGYKLKAVISGTEYIAEGVKCPATINTREEGKVEVTLYGKDSLWDKLDPIPVGGSRAGIVCFVFEDLAGAPFGQGSTLTFSYKDALGRTYSKEDIIGASKFPRHLSGVDSTETEAR